MEVRDLGFRTGRFSPCRRCSSYGDEPAVLLGGHELCIVPDTGPFDGDEAVVGGECQLAVVEGRHRVVEREERGDVEHVALVGTEVLEDDRSDDVSADIEPVSACAARRRVAAVDADHVIAVLAVEQVAAQAADDDVVAGTTLDHVVARIAAEVAVATPVDDLVVTTTTEQRVAAGVVGDDMEDIVTEAGADRCPSSLSADLDGVVAIGRLIVEAVVGEDFLVTQQGVDITVRDVEDVVASAHLDVLVSAAIDVDFAVSFAGDDGVVAGASADFVVHVAEQHMVVARSGVHGGVPEVLDEEVIAGAAVHDVAVL